MTGNFTEQASDHMHETGTQTVQESSSSSFSDKTAIDSSVHLHSKGTSEAGMTPRQDPPLADHDKNQALSILGEQLPGGYRIDHILGSGGYGDVFAGTDLNLDRPVAIKLFTRDIESQAAKRFRDEGRLIAKLNHPNIIQVYAFNHKDYDAPFLVMERFGSSLSDYLKKESGVMPVHSAARVVLQVLDALEAAHHLGVVHRDIKEANILFNPDSEQAKLCDFGIARAIEGIDDQAQTTREGFVIGTHHYIAPERYRGNNHDARSDLYSVGVLLYRLLIGRRPFERYSGEVIPPAVLICRMLEERARGMGDTIPRSIERICLRLLASKIDERYQDASSARKDLIEALESAETDSYEYQVSVSPNLSHVDSPLPKKITLKTSLSAPTPPSILGDIDDSHPRSAGMTHQHLMISAFLAGSMISALIWYYTGRTQPSREPKVIRLGSTQPTHATKAPEKAPAATQIKTVKGSALYLPQTSHTDVRVTSKPVPLSPKMPILSKDQRKGLKQKKTKRGSSHRVREKRQKSSPFVFPTRSP